MSTTLLMTLLREGMKSFLLIGMNDARAGLSACLLRGAIWLRIESLGNLIHIKRADRGNWLVAEKGDDLGEIVDAAPTVHEALGSSYKV